MVFILLLSVLVGGADHIFDVRYSVSNIDRYRHAFVRIVCVHSGAVSPCKR